MKTPAIMLAIKLCGNVEKAHELMVLGKENKIQSEYWTGIYHALRDFNELLEMEKMFTTQPEGK